MHWTKGRIDDQCRGPYRRYETELKKHYTEYFHQRLHLRCARHPYSARTIAAALPPGCSGLQQLMPPGTWHRFARSARSSQVLAVSILGSAVERDPSLCWLADALNLPPFADQQYPRVQFERALAPSDLGEVPRTTQLDFAVTSADRFIALEAKWSEPGLGSCSCSREGAGDPRTGFDCAYRVRSRRAYWNVAHKFLGLESVRMAFSPCTLSVFYQVVRNIAAAHRLSQGRLFAFVLVFDENNPCFRQTGVWPGWPHLLRSVLRQRSGLVFRAISWQRLVPFLPLSPEVRSWAWEKHRLA